MMSAIGSVIVASSCRRRRPGRSTDEAASRRSGVGGQTTRRTERVDGAGCPPSTYASTGSVETADRFGATLGLRRPERLTGCTTERAGGQPLYGRRLYGLIVGHWTDDAAAGPGRSRPRAVLVLHDADDSGCGITEGRLLESDLDVMRRNSRASTGAFDVGDDRAAPANSSSIAPVLRGRIAICSGLRPASYAAVSSIGPSRSSCTSVILGSTETRPPGPRGPDRRCASPTSGRSRRA